MQLYKTHDNLVKEGLLVTTQTVKARFLGNDQQHYTLIYLINYHKEKMGKVLKYGTMKNYTTTENYLKDFFKSTASYLYGYTENGKKLAFPTNIKKQLINKNSTSTYKYELMAIPNSEQWDFELKKLLTLEEIDIKDFNSISLQNFTGTIYTFNLDGTLKKVESYEYGSLIEETTGKGFKRIDAFKYEKPRWDEPSGCMTRVTTETWEDNWYIGSTNGAITSIRYTGSRLVNIQTEYVNTCSGVDPDNYPYNSGGVYRFHDHFDAPMDLMEAHTYILMIE